MGKLGNKIKKALFSICSENIAEQLYSYKNIGYNNISYSQEGEDLVLDRFLHNKSTGVYVDIGAHHPIRFSNTYKFYKKGWRGINIDAMPGSMIPFNKLRPFDKNLEIAISGTSQVLTYYMFNEPALNTLSEDEAKKKDGIQNYKIIGTKEIKTETLGNILNLYLSANTHIDFMSIDVEGLDLEVLQSNDWDKYKPTFLLVESLRENINELNKNKVYIYLEGIGYTFVAKTFNTMFFKYGDE